MDFAYHEGSKRVKLAAFRAPASSPKPATKGSPAKTASASNSRSWRASLAQAMKTHFVLLQTQTRSQHSTHFVSFPESVHLVGSYEMRQLICSGKAQGYALETCKFVLSFRYHTLPTTNKRGIVLYLSSRKQEHQHIPKANLPKMGGKMGRTSCFLNKSDHTGRTLKERWHGLCSVLSPQRPNYFFANQTHRVF